jgi:hypothetical protein
MRRGYGVLDVCMERLIKAFVALQQNKYRNKCCRYFYMQRRLKWAQPFVTAMLVAPT